MIGSPDPRSAMPIKAGFTPEQTERNMKFISEGGCGRVD